MKIDDDFSFDDPAFNKAVEDLWDSLYRYGYRMCRNHEDASDCVQRALVQALLHFDKIENFKPWMYKTLRTTCLNHLRMKKAHPSMSLIDDIDLPGLITEDEQRITVDVLLDEAPDYVRSIALMYYQGGTWEEIAETLEMPESTVRHHFRTWARRVREAYEVTGL